MTSGPVVAQVLEGENAVTHHRDLMGATDPKKAAPGTIRADFAESIEANSSHGSDKPGSGPRSRSRSFSQEPKSSARRDIGRAPRPAADRAGRGRGGPNTFS